MLIQPFCGRLSHHHHTHYSIPTPLLHLQNSLSQNSLSLSMSSNSETTLLSVLQRLIRSRNRDLSLFVPVMLGLTNPSTSTNPLQDSPNPDQESQNPRRRIVLINRLTQGMAVIEGDPSTLDSLVQELLNKGGQPPASRSSVEAMNSFEISGEDEVGECMICLEEFGIGGSAKEMPCKHRFHGGCIEKWLGIHGSCPVCRHKMPVEDEVVIEKSGGDGGGGGGGERENVRREIWVGLSFYRDGNGASGDQSSV